MKNTIIRSLLFCFAFTFYAKEGISQNICSQVLKNAQKVYDEGRLGEIESMLKPCLENGFSKVERLQAYRLLVISNLFLDEHGKAEVNMLQLLDLDPDYKVNSAVDPSEFIYLYNKYRVDAIFSIGFLGGINQAQISTIKPYGVSNLSDGSGEYVPNTGVQFGLSSDILIYKALQFNLSALYVQTKYVFNNTLFGFSEQTFQETQNWIQIPGLLKYTIGKRKLRPYLQAGAGADFLLNANAAVSRKNINTGSNEAIGPDIRVGESRNNMVFAAIGGGGLRYKVGYGYMVLDVRYNYGLNNLVKPESRYENADLVYRYGYLDNDRVMNTINVSIGYFKSFYKPKKNKNNDL
jgi:hypothetical protein